MRANQKTFTPPNPHANRPAFTLVELLVVISIIALLIGILLPALGRARKTAQQTVCGTQLHGMFIAATNYTHDNRQFFVPAAEDIGSTNLKRWHGQRTTAPPFMFTPPLPGNLSDYVFDPARSPLLDYLGVDGKIKTCPAFEAIRDPNDNAFEAGCGGYGYNTYAVGGRFDLYDVLLPGNYDKATQTTARPDEIRDPANTLVFADSASVQLHSGGDTYLIEYSFAEAPQTQFGPSSPGLHFRHQDRLNIVWADGHVTQDQKIAFSADSYTTAGAVPAATCQQLNVGWFGNNNNELWDTQ